MRKLLEGNIKEASVRRTAPQIAESNTPAAPVAVASADARIPVRAPWREEALAAPVPTPAPAPGSAAPIQPKVVKTLSVVKRGAQHATASATRQQVASAENTAPTNAVSAASSAPSHAGGWIIQVGAFPGEEQARDRLKSVQELGAGGLDRAEPFTERIIKGEATLYRARFAGFNEDRARAACKALKRNEIACLALRN
jgi:D-alanyl-D-alanine carboxypeptidase